MSNERLKLLIVDHSSCFCEKLHEMLYKIEHISISGHAENITEATVIFDVVKADIVLFDLSILDSPGTDFLNQIRIAKPGVLILGCFSNGQPFKKEKYPTLKIDFTFIKDTENENLYSILKNISDAVGRHQSLKNTA